MVALKLNKNWHNFGFHETFRYLINYGGANFGWISHRVRYGSKIIAVGRVQKRRCEVGKNVDVSA